MSLCFRDDILVILDDAGFKLRHINDDLPLIKEICSDGTSKFFFNRQHQNYYQILKILMQHFLLVKYIEF
ncbi:hypothetical protein pb186bvf_020926 [Paramecium bursaria]